jgi:hypothetical protein
MKLYKEYITEIKFSPKEVAKMAKELAKVAGYKGDLPDDPAKLIDKVITDFRAGSHSIKSWISLGKLVKKLIVGGVKLNVDSIPKPTRKSWKI